MVDGLEPCFLGREYHCCMEVPNCGFDARDLVDVVDGFVRGRPLALEHCCDVVGESPRGGDVIKYVEGLLVTQAGENECVGVNILDVVNEECAP